jgi:uncharacterized membrane protein YheB (UPF0754 family)
MAEIEEEQNIITESSKKYAGQLWGLISTQIERQANKNETIVKHVAPPKEKPRRKWLIKILFLFPLFLLLGFITSFWWDFPGVTISIFGNSILLEGVLKILTIGGLIGFMTNWVAIKMLFRPTYKRPILGQGLIPAQKERIAYRLAVAVSEDLINPEIIKKKIHESQAISKYREKATEYIKNIIDDPAFRSELKILLVSYVDEMMTEPEVRASIAKGIIEQINKTIDENSFERVALKTYSFFKGQEMQDLVEDALTKLPGGVEQGLDKMDEFLDTLPERIEKNSDAIEDVVTNILYRLINQLDVHALVEDNLRQYDEKRIELLIKNASNEQLSYIQYLGAVLGTLGGFIIWKPLPSLAVIGLIIGLTMAIDTILLRLKSQK